MSTIAVLWSRDLLLLIYLFVTLCGACKRRHHQHLFVYGEYSFTEWITFGCYIHNQSINHDGDCVGDHGPLRYFTFETFAQDALALDFYLFLPTVVWSPSHQEVEKVSLACWM
jgi:hypothetical protein